MYGISFPSPVAEGTKLTTSNGDRAGVVTSMVRTGPYQGSWRGLAYVRKGMGGPESQLLAGDVTGVVVEVPYATRSVLNNAVVTCYSNDCCYHCHSTTLL